MRFEQQISARLKSVVACSLAVLLFASGRMVSASGQTAAPSQTPAPRSTSAPQVPAQQSAAAVPGPELQLTSDEAVKLALENNLGIRAERLAPQVQALAVAQTRANYSPVVFTNSTKHTTTPPPQKL